MSNITPARVPGPDSPTSPVKDLTTRAMKMKQQSLEDRLELCLLELKKLCVREAVSTTIQSLYTINQSLHFVVTLDLVASFCCGH